MAGLKTRLQERPAAEQSPRGPKRALENDTDESPTKKPKINGNEPNLPHLSPPRTRAPSFGEANSVTPMWHGQLVNPAFAVQQDWRMPNPATENHNYPQSANPVAVAKPNEKESQAKETQNNDKINKEGAAEVDLEETDNGHPGTTDGDEDVDSDEEVKAVMAGIRHSLANPQPLVPPDWNQRADDRKVKRGLRFMARQNSRR